VVSRARELIGIPYRFGGTTVASGFDCSGLLVYLFRTEAGMRLPRTTGEMIDSDSLSIQRDDLKPGDAVFFNRNGRGNVSHVGLYIGNNQFIHAPSSGGRIRQDSLDDRYWERSFTTARRFNG
jgi:cell wall-associated NlpC family hydrolase